MRLCTPWNGVMTDSGQHCLNRSIATHTSCDLCMSLFSALVCYICTTTMQIPALLGYVSISHVVHLSKLAKPFYNPPY